MPTAFHVQIDTKDIEAGMRHIPDEIPFAVSLALTWTGRDAAAALRWTAKDYFTLRTDEVPKRMGYRMTRRGDQEILVGSKSPYMALQAEGGQRKNKEGGELTWVPVGARRNKQSITGPSRWPGKADDPGEGGSGYTGDVFTGWVTTKAGRRLGTWRRVSRYEAFIGVSSRRELKRAGKISKKGGAGTRTGLQLLYWADDQVNVKARWPLEQVVQDVVAESWEYHALKALDWTLKNPNRPRMKTAG